MTSKPTRAVLPATVLAVMLGLSACAGPAPIAPTTSDAERRVVTVGQASAVPDVVRATEEFGLTLLTSAPADKNAVVSPASAVIALSMLAEGSAGATADRFDLVLGAPGQDRTDAVNALLAALEVYAGDPAVVMEEELPDKPLVHVANQVVLDQDFTARPEFLSSLSQGYGAGVLVTDLSGAKGKKALDAWVKKNTGGLIEESAIEPRKGLRLVLQNATVLAAAWRQPFQEHATSEQPFTLLSGEQVQTETMAQLAQFKYFEAQGWQAVRLPYTEGLHMDVYLPPLGSDPAEITEELQAQLGGGLKASDPVLVDLLLPSVDIEAESLDLQPALETVGLGELFVGPNLSGISDLDLFLAQAVQQAVLTIDEAGTVAAAVTELAMEESSAPLVEDAIRFQVDRPYLLSIAHTDTSWPLFVAAIRDPRH